MVDIPESLDEQRGLARGLSREIIKEEAIRLGLLAEVGATAAGAAIENEAAYKSKLNNFLDPEASPSLAEQLAVMGTFWGGLALPNVTTEQFAGLAETVEANPDRRIIPTPLVSPAERRGLAAQSDFELFIPDNTWEFAELLKDPQAVVRKGDVNHGLRYKTADDRVVDRETYIEELKASGQAAEADDGTVWIFPAVNVSAKTPREETEAGNLHSIVHPLGAPEALLTVQLLHLTNGSANKGEWQLDLVNEAIYELDEDGNAIAPAYVATMAWLNANKQAESLYLNFWKPDMVSSSFGVRGVGPGLQAA